MAVLPLAVAQAGFFGRFEAGMQVDNRVNDPAAELEGLADITYEDTDEGLYSGLGLVLRQRDGQGDQQIRQLFLEKRLPAEGFSLNLGRVQRSDSLGFYTLDGGAFRIRRKQASLELYAGEPKRIEDYAFEGARELYGVRMSVNSRLDWGLPIEQLQARLGWQSYRDNRDDSVTRIDWGLSTQSAGDDTPPQPLELLFQGSYLPDTERVENLQARAVTGINEQTQMTWSYHTYRPDESQPDFKGLFYSSYARGRQHAVQIEFSYQADNGFDWLARVREVVHQHGENGSGGTLAVDWAELSGPRWQAELDLLQLGDERAATLYLQRRTTLTPHSRLEVSGVLQRQSRLSGDHNNALGLEARWERRLRSDLSLALYAMQIWNDQLQDDYRTGLRLSYRFDDRQRELLP